MSKRRRTVPYVARGLALSLIHTIEDLLTRKRLGHLTGSHHLNRMVERLTKIEGVLRDDGGTIWANLVESTRKDATTFDRSATTPAIALTPHSDDDFEEIFDLDEGPFESSQGTLQLARQFREWLQQAYVVPQRLIVDLDSRTVLFDGDLYDGFKCDEGLKMLKILAQQPTKKISLEELYRKAMGKKKDAKIPDDKKIRRYLKKNLCLFSSFIDSKNGVGQRLVFPSLPIAEGDSAID